MLAKRFLLCVFALLVSSTASADETPTLVLDGTPPIPAEIGDRLERYLEGRSAWLRGISDDGESVLISTRFDQTYQAHVVEQPMGMRRQLTFGAEPVGPATFVPGGGGDVLYRADIGGNETFQWFRLDPRTGTTTMITDGVSRHEDMLWSRSGERMAFNNNARNGKDVDIWIQHVDASEQATIVGQADGHWYPMSWSLDDQWLLGGHYVSATDQRLALMKADGTEQRTITNPKKPRAWGSAEWHPDGESLFVVVDRDGEFSRLYQAPLGKKYLSEKGWIPLTDDIDWNVDSVALSPDGETLAFVVNADGWSELWLLDVATGAKRRVDMEPSLLGSPIWARNANVLAFTRTGPTRTGDVFTLDVASGAVTQWTDSEMGGLSRDTLVSPELIRYPSFDGLSVPAWVYTPAGDGPHPVIISIHGGPEGQARPWYSSRAQSLVASGFAVVVPNVRGSSGYGRTWLTLDNGFKREDSVKDIGALLDWIAERPDLDAERVGVVGGSYGGYMVLACLTWYSDRIRAGVDVVGISNFVTFLENTKEYRRDLRRVEYGDERDPKMRAHLEAISPTTNVAKIQAALFVAHGANDPRVPLGEATQIVEAVRAGGHDVWSMVAHDEGHGFRKKKNKDIFEQLQLLFFEKHLLGEVAE